MVTEATAEADAIRLVTEQLGRSPQVRGPREGEALERRIAADRAGRRRRGISVDAGATRVTLGLESGALELTPGIGAAAELAKTTFEETDMARSRGGRRVPPPDILPDIFAEEPEAATRADAPVKSQEPTRPEALPDIVAELKRIGTQLDALANQNTELSGGVERSAGAAAGAEAAIGELRSSVDAAAKGTTQAHDNLSARLAKMEAAVGELQTLPQSAKDVAHRLEVTEKGLVAGARTWPASVHPRLRASFRQPPANCGPHGPSPPTLGPGCARPPCGRASACSLCRRRCGVGRGRHGGSPRDQAPGCQPAHTSDQVTP